MKYNIPSILSTIIAVLLVLTMLATISAALKRCESERGQNGISCSATVLTTDIKHAITASDAETSDTAFPDTSETITSEHASFTAEFRTESSITELPQTATPTTDLPITDPLVTDPPVTEPITEVTSPEPIEWPVTSDHALLRQILTEAASKYGAVGIQVAVIKEGKVGATGVFGWQTCETVPMTNDTKIRVASLSKTTVAMVTLRLVDEGLLDLDENVETYLGFPMRNYYYPDTVITLRHLLAHTVGFRYVDYATNLEELQAVLTKKSTYQNHLPGTAEAYYYSNFGYGVIGTICELVTGESLSALANTYFFAPMGIEASWSATGFDPLKLATIYDADHRVGLSVEELLTRLETAAPAEAMRHYAGGLIISALDYAKLLTLFMNDGVYEGERYLSSARIVQMKTVQVPKNEMADQCLALGRYYGLYGEDVLYYHTGSAYGVYALYTFDDATGTGAVIVTTGAEGVKDENGLYAVCSEIAAQIHHNREEFAEAASTEAVTESQLGNAIL